jgi:hypothetical protein
MCGVVLGKPIFANMVLADEINRALEAYVKPQEIPDDAICPEERHAGGGWLGRCAAAARTKFADGAPPSRSTSVWS